jgi:DNA polymerase III subunit gamma/tau
LINALKSGAISHAYLFTGPRGTGKTSTARLISKAIMCANLKDGFDPCDECDFCKDINAGNLIDLVEIDAASNRGIDEVRDLKEKISFSPTRSKFKIYIIDEVHMMTKEAFNALLKTLEEPPSHAYFILATTEAHKIPETIISRCQRFDFRRITVKALMTRLSYIAQKEGINAEDKALEAISKYVDGGLRDAIGLMEQLSTDKKLDYKNIVDVLGMSDFALLEKFYQELVDKNTNEAIKIVNDVHNQGHDLRQFLHELLDLLRQEMLKSVSSEDKELTGKLVKMVDVFQEANKRLDNNIPQLALEIATIQICGALTQPKEGVSVPAHIEKKEDSPVAQKTEKIESEISREHRPIENAVEMNTANLKEQWPRIIERIKTPALKRSLGTASPIKAENFEIYLEFKSAFHKDKTMESDNRVELEQVAKNFFGTEIKIIASVGDFDIKPVVDDNSDAETLLP